MSHQDREPHQNQIQPNYRGRFAPSPTGPLHLGSLTTALGSYLDARANQGEWLLRIEDIDPPREEEGAKTLIPIQLEEHGLLWDGAISYQSSHAERYQECIQKLVAMNVAYRCDCSRQRIKSIGGVYDRHCLTTPPATTSASATRFKIDHAYEWFDHVLEKIRYGSADLGGDFVIYRKDGLFSYQLAVAADDHAQGITHVVRGADLLDSTARQGLVMQAMGWQPPVYAHLPVVIGDDGKKLSKQNYAPPLDPKKATQNLFSSLQLLGQNPPAALQFVNKEELLGWAVSHWHLSAAPKSLSAS